MIHAFSFIRIVVFLSEAQYSLLFISTEPQIFLAYSKIHILLLSTSIWKQIIGWENAIKIEGANSALRAFETFEAKG